MHVENRRTLCRRLVGLADPVHRAVRRRRGGRLCAAGAPLADVAHRGRAAVALPAPCRSAGGRRRSRVIVVVSIWTPLLLPHSRSAGSAGPASSLTSPVPILVALLRAGASGTAWRRASTMHALPVRARLVRAVLRRAGHQPLAADGAAVDHHLGRPRRRRPARHSCWSGAAVLMPDHPALHRLSPTGCSAARWSRASTTTEPLAPSRRMMRGLPPAICANCSGSSGCMWSASLVVVHGGVRSARVVDPLTA